MEYEAAEAASDRFLGRLLRFHPERAVTPSNPLVEPLIIEKVIEVPAAPIPIPTPNNIAHLTYRPSIERVLSVVCDFYEVSLIDLISARRTKELVRPRFVAMYLSRELTLHSLPVIGKHMGDRDHTTILNGLNRIETQLISDRRLRDEIDVLRLHLKEPEEVAA